MPELKMNSKFYGKDKVYHVRGFVDDFVVVRWWNMRRQYWQYEIREVVEIEAWFKAELYSMERF